MRSVLGAGPPAALPTHQQADVPQDALLQRGQRRLQVGAAHIVLRKPLGQRLRGCEGAIRRGPAPQRQLVPVEQSPNLVPNQGRNLLQTLTG